MYIIEYIKESQAEYPSISQSPVDVLRHLLYVNGNGVVFENGNPVITDSNQLRYIEFREWYKQFVPFSYIVDMYNRHPHDRIQDTYNLISGMEKIKAKAQNRSYDHDATWAIAHDKCYQA
jgi:hypothetical protein